MATLAQIKDLVAKYQEISSTQKCNCDADSLKLTDKIAELERENDQLNGIILRAKVHFFELHVHACKFLYEYFLIK
jgi:hypothetical protein